MNYKYKAETKGDLLASNIKESIIESSTENSEENVIDSFLENTEESDIKPHTEKNEEMQPIVSKRYKYDSEEEVKEANRRKARERYQVKKDEILAKQKVQKKRDQEELERYRLIKEKQS